jgi:tetratricopeptide (TPR) repeat protein/tRNA A-37 threonylcarbamoyl transferase component Bud32
MSDPPPPLPPCLAEARQIDQTCDRFEAAWKAGPRPRPEAYLGAAGEPVRSALLRQLLLLDWDYRRRAGDNPCAGDYHARFPDDTALIEGVCREMTEAADSTCVDPDGPRAAHTPWAGDPRSALPGEAAAEAEAGLARYDLLQEVGEGGIGVVFRGRDRVLGRELAVKVLRDAYRDDPDARRRFTEEARVGSQLQHPAIVPVYELGRFDDGRPYLTMKLVEGYTFAALLHGRTDLGQDLPRWLGVFAQVCQAMAYAHARGVVHRDLKPANVMVGAFGEVQVMDWGFAKQLRRESGGDASESCNPQPAVRNGAGATQSGALMGTPAYMPPEQARGEAALIDARADVFALGAILCEILTGRPPYVGGTADAVCRQAAAGDLSDAHARLDACGADAALRELAKRCLAADRAARPPDAGVVAGELTAYLASAQERLRQAQLERAAAEARAQEAAAKAKAERRARRLTLALAAVVVLLAVGMVVAPTVSLAFVREEQRRTQEALQAEARRRQQARQALDMLAGPVIEDWLGKQPALSPDHKKFLEQALAIYTEFAAETSTDEASRAGLAHAYYQIGNIQRIRGRMPQAEEAYDRGAELYTRLAAEAPGRTEYRRGLARLLVHRITVWRATGRGGQAEAALRDLVPLQRKWAAASPDPDLRLDLAHNLVSLSFLSLKRGQLPDAEALVREAVADYENLLAQYPARQDAARPGWCRAQNNLGMVLSRTGRFDEAERAFLDARKWLERMAAASPDLDVRHELGHAHTNLARLLYRTARQEEAEAAQQEALKVRQKLAADFPGALYLQGDLAATHTNLGMGLASRGRPEDADEAYRRAIALYRRIAAKMPHDLDTRFGLGLAHFCRAELLRKMKRPEAAEAADCAASGLFEKLVDEAPDVPDYRHHYAGSLTNRARWHQRRGELAEARRLLDVALLHHRVAIRANPRYRDYRQFLYVNRSVLVTTFLVGNQHAGLAEAAEQLAAVAREAAAEAGIMFPLELSWGAAFLARCASLAAQDAKLPDARRAELARSYAERAMATLRLAVQHGYRDAARLKTDPFFASVRLRADFQELVAELEKRQQKP